MHYHVPDGSDVELQAWLKAAPESPADKADLLPKLSLIFFAEIDHLLRMEDSVQYGRSVLPRLCLLATYQGGHGRHTPGMYLDVVPLRHEN